ncbi:hypothetical protein MKX07_008164 [Trichoderma sp. CBMAI-0711]|nr:hypothetical protein MKX07_008164 [Trichoderma sp. CBMAI-0711]
MVRLEQGTEPDFAQALGFGKGENMGTKALRAEMHHIDFIRLCNRKYGQSVYSPEGSGPGRDPGMYYKTPNRNKARPDQVPCPLGIEGILVQFQVGATGFGLIDAIMRQLLCTGYISIRSQMLAANFLGKFAGVDWRYGVEWVASLSIEHDTSLHWHRWQHYVGIGPDPSGGEATFSPAHAALEFDPDGHFVREWMPELRRLTALPNLFKVATTSAELLQLLGLATSVMVTRPVPSNAVNCQRFNHRRCGGLHPQLFVSRPPHGFVTLGPYPRLLLVARSSSIIPIQAPSLCSCPPPPPGPPRPPLVSLYLPRPRSCGGSPEYFVVPRALLFAIFRQTLAWSLQITLAAWMDLHQQTTRAMVEMAPLQDAEASSHPGLDREPLLSARDSHMVPDNAHSGPNIANSASRAARHDAAGGPTAMTATSRGPTIVVSDPRAVAAAAALRGAHGRPATGASPPSGPRAERAAEATQATPRMHHVAPIIQHHATAQRPSGVFQDHRVSTQAPPNAPQGPRANYRPPPAQSNAPPNAPRGPRADYWPSQPPRNPPQGPRGQPWQYHTPQGESRANRALNWQYQQRRNVVPENISTVQSPQISFNALQTAPRAPQAMQPFPAAPQWTPQMAEPFVGATNPTTYPYSLYTSPPCPAFYGSYAFSRPATYQYMEELPYYQVLQDYHQWHASGPSGGGGPWNATPPDTDEVMRHGMILRFLDSLPPPPSNPEFPPDPPQLYLKTRRRRRNRTQSSRRSGVTGQTESTEGTTAITRPVVPIASADASPPQAAQRMPYRRGKRGTSGRHRQANDDKKDGSDQSDKSGASGEAVDVADAAEAVESADGGDIVETHENGQKDGEGEECDGQDEDVEDDCASAATCMW